MHWNTPANPVNFEQREGRVDRYAGHAIRRNIVAKHREAILRSDDYDPWKAAFRLGLDEQERFGEFAPWWVYPGPAKIERIVMPYPLSIDNERLASLKRDVQLYRLTFGQPRQEDMLELLKQLYESESDAARASARPSPTTLRRCVALGLNTSFWFHISFEAEGRSRWP